MKYPLTAVERAEFYRIQANCAVAAEHLDAWMQRHLYRQFQDPPASARAAGVLDGSPGAYKSIYDVMDAQNHPPTPTTSPSVPNRADIADAYREALQVIVENARLIPDPQMEGMTDCFAVPLDDIETACRVLCDAGESVKIPQGCWVRTKG